MFAHGQYAPGTQNGMRLLAHELAHVAQSSASGAVTRLQHAPLTVSHPAEPDEVEATTLADAVMRGAAPGQLGPGAHDQVPTAEGARPTPTLHGWTTIRRQEGEPPPFEPRPGAAPRGPAVPVPDLDVDPTLLTEPNCPPLPTRLGNLTPAPACDVEGEDIDGEPPYLFCPDSDTFRNRTDLGRLRNFVSGQRSGTEFRVRAYSSVEGPGPEANRDQYNRNLACHRLNRMIRELLNLGVQDQQIDAVAMGPTTQFAEGAAGRPANRRAVIQAVPPSQVTRPSAAGMTMDQIRDAARDRITSGDYPLAADAYTFRWSCGRFRTLAEAVAKTTIVVGSASRASAELGTTETVGPNSIVISPEISNATDPIGCAANRIVDLTFHHVSRPVLSRFDDQHRGGLHLVSLAGLQACQIPLDPLNSQFNTRSQPSRVDPFVGFLPSCADRPLFGPLPSQRGPATMDTPPVFTVSSLTVTNASGSVTPSPPSPGPTVGAEPDNPFALAATVDATGDPATIRRYEIGFLQTVAAESWSTTYSDGRRERRRFPLPLRDGAPTGDPNREPPWFSRTSKVRATPGTNQVAMDDAPNMRAFKILPDLAASTFVATRDLPQPGAPRPIRIEHADFRPSAGPLLPANAPPDEVRAAQALRNNAPDRGFRRLVFNTWVVARRGDPRAPETHGATEFLAGKRLVYAFDVDWQPTAAGVQGRGSWSLAEQAVGPDDAAAMVLRGAVPGDFVSDGVPLFAEFLEIDAALPRAEQPGRLSLRDYIDAVRRIAAPRRVTPALRQELIVVIRVQVATGRADLDTPDLLRAVVRIENAQGNQLGTSEATAFAREIFPEVRKLVAGPGLAPNEPQSGTMPVAVRLPALTGQP